jgi:hypothetical protein
VGCERSRGEGWVGAGFILLIRKKTGGR